MNDEYYVYPVVGGTNWQEHTLDHPFCGDMSCPCHEDQDNIDQLGEQYQDGLVSREDADRIYRGKTI